MSSGRSWWRSCRRVLRLDRSYDEIDEELELHLEMKARELEGAGLDPGEARAEARRLFGDLARIRHACRAIRREGLVMRSARALLESLAQDLRYGVRSPRRTPALALTAILTLAIGIGATTAA